MKKIGFVFMLIAGACCAQDASQFVRAETNVLGAEYPRVDAAGRVQVRIKDTKFDRIVRTDTIVGDKSFTPDQLAARTAREVLAILRPHLRRALPVR